MKKPLLTSELVLTLQQLEGIGNKTILSKIGNKIQNPISTLKELFNHCTLITGKKFESLTYEKLNVANGIAKRIISESHSENIGIITYYDNEYPDVLKKCTDEKGNPDPPLILFYRGNIDALKLPAIAVIGTREPTPNGIKAGEFFAAEFAKHGFNIVSGLAIGCDTTGHKGALKVQGITTAFLANGLDWESIYPKENLELAKTIVANNGVLLSEYPIGQSCGRYGLVARDRLQAGLAKATIVIQTGEKGGTMHAVNATLASNKPLFVVEYKNSADISHNKVQGNIMLIRDKGANALQSTGIDKAIAIIEGKESHNPTVSQPSLFD
ncbi:MAG: DNA-protecting protein DprA [Muribaculaceae bacterium]|nr:DNA-protecting protein DprA [Muribaculaceae bacterium]